MSSTKCESLWGNFIFLEIWAVTLWRVSSGRLCSERSSLTDVTGLGGTRTFLRYRPPLWRRGQGNLWRRKTIKSSKWVTLVQHCDSVVPSAWDFWSLPLQSRCDCSVQLSSALRLMEWVSFFRNAPVNVELRYRPLWELTLCPHKNPPFWVELLTNWWWGLVVRM